MFPRKWFDTKIIPVPKAVREKHENQAKNASYKDLTNRADGQFKWLKEYKIAHQKMEKHRNEFDKKIIKLNERYEVLQGIFLWKYMKIIPIKNDKEKRWVLPLNRTLDSNANNKFENYIEAIYKAIKSHNYSKAESALNELKKYQRNFI